MNAKKTPFPSFEGARLLVAGDLMLDQYTWGDVERVSPEAPVLVLRAEQEEVRLGGAASVAGLLAGLKMRGIVAGVVGDDPAGRIVARLLSERHEPSAAAVPHDCLAKARGRGACSGCRNGKLKPAPIGAELCRTEGIEDRDILVVDPARPTTVKERLLGRAANRYPHQILRLDRESRRPLTRALERRLLDAITVELPRCQAVLVSDYAKGVCTPRFLARLIKQAREAEVPVLVDPARGVDFDRYRGATLIKANRQEAELALGCPIRHRRHAFAAGRELCRNWDLQAAMVTLDREGIVLVTADGVCRHFEARVHEVCDVTGAGDTVLAVVGCWIASGASWDEAAEAANAAAMLQIQKIGVGQVTREELKQALAKDAAEGHEPTSAHDLKCRTSKGAGGGCWAVPPSKVVSVEELLSFAEAARERQLRIVFANGCFDLLHVGHVTCLNRAAELGELLVVAVNSDSSVRRLKGRNRPVVNETNRAAMIAALEVVDRVVILDADDPCELLGRVKPDVLVKGGGYRLDQVVGREIVEDYGGRVELVEHVSGVSTSQIVASLH